MHSKCELSSDFSVQPMESKSTRLLRMMYPREVFRREHLEDEGREKVATKGEAMSTLGKPATDRGLLGFEGELCHLQAT